MAQQLTAAAEQHGSELRELAISHSRELEGEREAHRAEVAALTANHEAAQQQSNNEHAQKVRAAAIDSVLHVAGTAGQR